MKPNKSRPQKGSKEVKNNGMNRFFNRHKLLFSGSSEKDLRVNWNELSLCCIPWRVSRMILAFPSMRLEISAVICLLGCLSTLWECSSSSRPSWASIPDMLFTAQMPPQNPRQSETNRKNPYFSLQGDLDQAQQRERCQLGMMWKSGCHGRKMCDAWALV